MSSQDQRTFRIGEESVGEFAQTQLKAAREDPRVSRDDGRAMMADFWDAIEEAERIRTLTEMGLRELTLALEREEERQGVKHDATEIPPAAAPLLQAAWERAEWARAEVANQSPHSNAQALISERITDEIIEKGKAAVPEAATELNPKQLDALKQVVRDLVDEKAPKALRPKGSGISRYEKPLRRIGWQAAEDRPIPRDLDLALTELGSAA